MNTLSLSAKAGALKPSPTLGITAKANQLKADGVDVVSFAAGEPDFPTPEAICSTAIEAIEAGFTKYTPSSGIPELKRAIAEKLATQNQVSVAPEQVVVSCGAKQSVYNSMQVLLDPGDEVLLIAPYWMTYAEQITLAGGRPVVIATNSAHGYVPTGDQLRAAIGPRTKAIILNSPSNPTGAVFPRETIEDIAGLAVRHGFWIVADEIYERIIYGVEHVSAASLGRDVADQTVTIGGCSKTYAMTGWRIGFAAAPLVVAKAMSNLQDQVTSNPTSFAQKGAVTAFRLPADQVEAMRSEFEARRDLIVSRLQSIPGVSIQPPKGAFYAFADFSSHIRPGETDVELATFLLETAHVATVPGSVFEGPGHLRLSYAASRNDIERGVARIGEALARRAQ